MNTSSGIHHITAITSDPQASVDFYEGFLGQHLVKRTVNFDDPSSYHFYFGDAYGKPGTLLTFFFWTDIPHGTKGTGEVSRIAYGISLDAKEFWMKRAEEYGVPCFEASSVFGDRVLSLEDPDGITIDLVLMSEKPMVEWWHEGPIPQYAMLHGFFGATLSTVSTEEMRPVLLTLGYILKKQIGEHTRFETNGERAHALDLFEAPDLPLATQGSGSVHHIAFRAASDEEELELRMQIESLGMRPTPIIDRQYFRSVYFMTPGRVLFELATDEPGFAIDETKEALGEKLVLPPQYEVHRQLIEGQLVPITLPRHA